MGEKKFTLVELHLDGNTQFGPKTIAEALPIGSNLEADEEIQHEREAATDEDEAATADEDGGRGSAIGVLLGLVVLVLVAVAVKKFRSGDDEPSIDAEQPDVVVN